MKMRTIAAAALLACTGLAFAMQPESPKPQGRQEKAPSQEEMKKMMEDMAKPSEEIRELAKQVNGTWKVSVKSWMELNGEPQESSGTARFEPAVGDKVIRQTFRGEFMGQEFRGEGLLAYHTAAGRYQSTWVDSMTGTIMLSEGKKNAKGQLEFKDEYTCPMEGTEKTGKTVFTFDGPDKMTLEMWTDTSDGGSFKTMELVYTRASGPEGTRPTIEPRDR